MTNHYIIAANLADIHRNPDSQSERVTQALMNVPITAGEISGEWTHITLPDYAGWVQSQHLEEPIVRGYCEGDEGACGITLPYSIVVTAPQAPLYTDADGDETQGELYLSTVLPYIDLTHPQRLRVALPGHNDGWLVREHVEVRNDTALFPRQNISTVIKYAHAFLDRPYLWGGVSWQGLDCSGFVQLCYRMGGDILPRDADQQHDFLPQHIERSALQAGDLIFFGHPHITHVALALNENEYIHAEGQVYERVLINSLEPTSPHYNQRLAEIVYAIKRVR